MVKIRGYFVNHVEERAVRICCWGKPYIRLLICEPGDKRRTDRIDLAVTRLRSPRCKLSRLVTVIDYLVVAIPGIYTRLLIFTGLDKKSTEIV